MLLKNATIYNDQFETVKQNITVEGERITAIDNRESGDTVLDLAGYKGKSYQIEILTLSEIVGMKGATLVNKKENSVIYKVDFPNKGKELFIDHQIEIVLK